MELLDDAVEQILLRFPPADPASLVNAALVCKAWCRIVCGPSFRRQFEEFHRAAPLLGFFCNPTYARFVPTSSLRLLPPHEYYEEEVHHCAALDARHGLVLLRVVLGDDEVEILVVWDPRTGERWEIPVLDICEPCYWYATVLRAPTVNGARNRLDRQDFIVVRLVTHQLVTRSEHFFLRVYSSMSASWSETILVPECTAHLTSTALVGNKLYFSIDCGFSVLGFDLATSETSVIPLPIANVHDKTVLMEMEGAGLLGFARLDAFDDTLSLWSMEVNPNGDMSWTHIRVIQLEKPLPLDHCPTFEDFFGFAHGVDVFFVATKDERLFIFDLKSETLRETCGVTGLLRGHPYIVPYTSFCTPALGLVGTEEEPALRLTDGDAELSSYVLELKLSDDQAVLQPWDQDLRRPQLQLRRLPLSLGADDWSVACHDEIKCSGWAWSCERVKDSKLLRNENHAALCGYRGL